MRMGDRKPEGAGRSPVRYRGLLVGAFCGALVGCVVPLLAVESVAFVAWFTLIGLGLGAAVGGRVIRVTGCCMILGAILGGIAFIIITRHGKGALTGAPLGAILGMVAGLFLEDRFEQPRAARPQQ